MIQRIAGGHDAAGAVTEQKHGQARVARLGELDEVRDVADVLRDGVDVEALAVRLAAPAQVEGVDGESAGGQLPGRPQVLPAVGVDAMADDDDRARPPGRPPRRGR